MVGARWLLPLAAVGGHQNHIEKAIEAIGELRQVTWRVLGKVKRMVGACQGCLQVSQHGVDPAQLRSLCRLSAPAGDVPLMAGAHLGDLGETLQTV